jgi:hypothetical protein
MADIEIKLRMECNDCGAVLVHFGSKLVDNEAHIRVLRCINCDVVNSRRRAAEMEDLQSKIKSLQSIKESKL